MRELLAAKGARYRRRQRGKRLHAVLEKRLADGRSQGTSENYQRLIFAGNGAAAGEIIALDVHGQEGQALLGQRIATSAAEKV